MGPGDRLWQRTGRRAGALSPRLGPLSARQCPTFGVGGRSRAPEGTDIARTRTGRRRGAGGRGVHCDRNRGAPARDDGRSGRPGGQHPHDQDTAAPSAVVGRDRLGGNRVRLPGLGTGLRLADSGGAAAGSGVAVRSSAERMVVRAARQPCGVGLGCASDHVAGGIRGADPDAPGRLRGVGGARRPSRGDQRAAGRRVRCGRRAPHRVAARDPAGDRRRGAFRRGGGAHQDRDAHPDG